jgi:hypothetical protein
MFWHDMKYEPAFNMQQTNYFYSEDKCKIYMKLVFVQADRSQKYHFSV